MRFHDKFLLGLLGGGAALWAGRSYLRSRRKIGLEGRVVVVTGASSGLGLLTARYAAAHGARLAITARDADRLDAAADDLRRSGSPDVLAVPADLANRADGEALIARTIDHFGRIDVLVNNAGIMLVAPIENMTVEDFERVMAINYWGVAYPTLAAIPHMQRQRFGRICNVSSIGGKLGVPHMLAYVAAKFAVSGFSEGLRGELAKDNILVTAVYPGTIRTGGHRHAEFKGNVEAEYSWFSPSDVIPGLSVSAHRCAEALWDATLHGDPELIFGLHAKLAIGLHNLLPNWYAELNALAGRAMPGPTEDLGGPVRGSEIRGPIPDFANQIIPEGTRPRPA